MRAIDFKQLFTRIPLLEHCSPMDFKITPLPGYTNRNYRLVNRQQDWVLRIPQSRTNRYIDREAEAANQAGACDLDLAPRPVWRDASGLTLTSTISAGRGVTAGDLADAQTRGSIVDAVRRLHQSGHSFQGRVQLEQLLSRYYSLLSATQQQSYRDRMQDAQALLPRLRERDCAEVPSHNDLVLENLLLERGRVWMIDWEFSAMASPYWDLATLSNAAGLDDRQSRQLLEEYCAGGEVMKESLLFDYRNLLQLLSDCWMAALVD